MLNSTNFYLPWILLFLSPPLLGQSEDLQLLNYYQYYQDDANALYKQMVTEASAFWESRENRIAELITADDWKDYQQSVRNKLQQIIGLFPEKTPLNSRVTGILDRPDFTVEKIAYESQPGFFVTAALFLPTNLTKKAPAVVYCSGHTSLAFRSDTYQTKIINLVRKGFIVLAFDPVGQGERMQYPDESGQSSQIGGPTHEHSYVGAQCFMTGSSLAKYMIWDGIRSVDYLLSRPEVDPQRIGITGRSGGGTQTALIAAFDDRIYAAAPEAYITRLDILLKTRGPQDAEQNLPYFAQQQLDLADLLITRAPKPTLIISTTRDFFSIEGARQSYSEIKHAYKALDNESNINMSEDDSTHASTTKNREAMYAFFQDYLQNPGNSDEEEVKLFAPKELWVTDSGQVAISLNSRNVFDLNRVEAQRKEQTRQERKSDFDPDHIIAVAKKSSGFQAPAQEHQIDFAGQYQREGYVVQKYLMIGQDHVNPFLLFVPNQVIGEEVVLYFHPEGKAAQAQPEQEIEQLVKQGKIVLSADLLGTGELGPGYLRGDAHIDDVSYNQWFGGILINKSIIARQAADMLKMVDYLKSKYKSDDLHITAVGRSTLTPALLHAAAFEPAITQTILINPLISYQSLVTNEVYDARWVPSAVAGSVGAYDLADLATTLIARSLWVVNPVDHQFNEVPVSDFNKEWEVVRVASQPTDSFRVFFSSEENEGETWISQLK
ncbi:MAG: acetylxylan esterase [Bacteroidota bacterium]